MPHRRPDERLAVRTNQVWHIFRFSDVQVSLELFELRRREYAIEVATHKLADAVLLVLEHPRSAHGAVDVEHSGDAATDPSEFVFFRRG